MFEVMHHISITIITTMQIPSFVSLSPGPFASLTPPPPESFRSIFSLCPVSPSSHCLRRITSILSTHPQKNFFFLKKKQKKLKKKKSLHQIPSSEHKTSHIFPSTSPKATCVFSAKVRRRHAISVGGLEEPSGKGCWRV